MKKFLTKSEEYELLWEQYDGIPNKENNAKVIMDKIFKDSIYDLKNNIYSAIHNNTLTDTQYRNLLKLDSLIESIWVYPEDRI